MCSQSSLEQSIRHFLVPKWELQIQLTTNRLIHKPSIDEGWVEPAQTTFSANKMSQVKAAVGFSSFAQEIISICRLKVLTPAKMASQICFQASEEKKQRCKLWKLQGRTIQKFSRNGKKVVPVISTKSVAALAGQDSKHAVTYYCHCTVLPTWQMSTPAKGARILLGKDILKCHSFLFCGDCKAMMQRLILLNPDLWT